MPSANSPQSSPAFTGMTLAEKIIARAAGRDKVAPGEVVTCNVDLAMVHDSSGPRRIKPILERLKAPIWDPFRVVMISDHYVPAFDDETRQIADVTRRFAVDHGIAKFYDGQGICHVVLPERGHLRPGMLVVGGDSHSPTGGAFGAYMFGIGSTEMAGVFVTGEIWLRVPETIEVNWQGNFARGVVAKDAMLFLCARMGLEGGRSQAVHYTGSAVTALPMQERMTLSNMTTELGGQTGLIAPDEITADYVRMAGGEPGDISYWHSDADAASAERHTFDADLLEPHVAAPHSPANSEGVTAFARTSIDLAYIGACTGAKLVDLRMAAEVLKGKRVASSTKLLVAPASRRDQDRAAAEGTLQILQDAGATILPNACGICAGYGGSIADGEVCLSSTARNFRGRMGPTNSPIYLGSPYTVAASAITGTITDPRQFLNG